MMSVSILVVLLSLSTLAFSQRGVLKKRNSMEGPHFLHEPNSRMDFTNNTGARISCEASGKPPAKITWSLEDGTPAKDLTGLRLTLPDGNLVFPPFRPEDYRQDVHSAVYTCSASNAVGTIVSRDVQVKAVMTHIYDVQVYDAFVIRGNNTGILKCHIPSFLIGYVRVTGWLRDNVVKIDANFLDGKYLMVPSNGHLFVRQVGHHDAGSTYRCQTHHRLSKESKLSTSAGRLFVTDPQGNIPPRILDPLATLQVKAGENVILPCPAQGYPQPTLTWYIKDVTGHLIPVPSSGRYSFHREVLAIKDAQAADSAMYVCVASNIVGAAKTETALTVIEPLHAHIQPKLNIISVGKATTLHCVIIGSPISSVTWLKNGHRINSDRITRLSRDVIRITHTNVDDIGMYQCVVKNEFESVQATAELRLGEVFPEIHHAFQETIVQPGQSVSLQCLASGSPTPQISWTVDGLSLPMTVDRQRVQETLNADGDVVSTLHLTEANVEDGGLYVCAAINILGRIQHQARLNIYGPLTVRSIPKFTLIDGKDALLNCPYFGYPVHTIVWVRAGETLPIDLRQQVLENGTLKLREVQHSVDSGKYTCIVGNKEGSSAKGEIDVNVVVPVKILPFSFQGNLLSEGMRAQLQCVVAEGDLPITLKWLKDNHLLPSQLGIAVRSLDDFSSMLTISNVTARHNGNYTCIAANTVSQDSHTTKLNINVPPKWVLPPTNVSVFAGQSASFHCQADGFPLPTIKWFRAEGLSLGDQEPVHSNHEYKLFHNGTLYIPSSRIQLRGSFFCKASNGIGVGLSKLVHLTIHDNPINVLAVPPTAERKKSNQTARVGFPLTLQCVVIGEKPITFTWRKNGQVMDLEKTRYKLHNFDLQNKIISELTILNVVREDSAAHSCTADNDHGKDATEFSVIVEETPSHPVNLTIKYIGNQTLLASWKAPFNGNTPITKYVVQYKEVSDGTNIRDRIQNASVSGSQSSMHIAGLRPSTKYEFRILAINKLGQSEPSKLVFFTTGDEAPSAPPQLVKVDPADEKTLKVSWKPPKPEFWNGNIRGYFIGYKIASTSLPYTYHRLEVPDDYKETLSYSITNLKKFTQYVVVVQAINNGGKSPPSTEVVAMTSEGVPSKPPVDVRCFVLTSETIHITWQPPPPQSINGIMKGFKVLYQPAEEWYDYSQLHFLTATLTKVTLRNLYKYTNYSIEVLAFTKKGDGIASDPIYCQTLEDVPKPPADIKVLPMSPDSVLVSWKRASRQSGLIIQYTVHVQLNGDIGIQKDIAKYMVPGNVTSYEIYGLTSNAPYDFWITARTKIGDSPKSKIVQLTPKDDSFRARLASFGEFFHVVKGVDLKLPCLSSEIPFTERKWSNGFHILEHDEKYWLEPNGYLIIKNTERSDDGNYTCTINNEFGDDSITHSVLVLSTPDAPTVQISLVAANFIDLHWESKEEKGSPIASYVLHYKQENRKWNKIEIHANERSYNLRNLQCGTEYQCYIIAKNKLGESLPSNIVITRTNGSVPELPNKNKLLEEGFTTVTVRLDAWQTDICTIQNYVVQYRQLDKNRWTTVGDDVKPAQRSLVIRDLNAATRYRIRITANNPAGSTKAEYDLLTLTTTDATVEPDGPLSHQKPIILSFTDKKVLIPAGLSLAIVIILMVMSYLCLRFTRRVRQKKSNYHHQEDSEPYAIVRVPEVEFRSTTPESQITNKSKSKHKRPMFEHALRLATGSIDSSRPLLSSKRGRRNKNSPLSLGHNLGREETTFVFSDSEQGLQQGKLTNQSGSCLSKGIQRNKFFRW